jgi:hypothetical protein
MKARAHLLPPRSDHELGIKTTRNVPLDALSIDSENRVHAHRYEPSPFAVLPDMLLGLGLDYPRYTFIDLGSGKGRVLCVAAGYPWRRVLGVEFGRELHEEAERNIARLAPSRRRCRDVRSLHKDATELALPEEPTVLYLFNPFTAPVLARILDRLEEAHRVSAVERWVLYYMPVLEDLLARRDFLEPVSAAKDWRIYRTAPPR